MKEENMPNRLYIPQPFASGTDQITAELTPIDTQTGDSVNFVDGFPSVYESPTSQGGKLVSRGEMNAIGNLASVNEYYRRCGGINTFDPELAMKIGGYARGAVLEIIENLNYHKVISLVDDNKVDFNGDELTVQQKAAGITLGSVDGVNWAYCANGVIDTSEVVAEMPDFTDIISAKAWVEVDTLGSFKAKQNGVVSFEGTFTCEPISTEAVGDLQTGFMILLTDHVETSIWDYKAKVIYIKGSPSFGNGSGIVYSDSDATVAEVVKGNRYALYIAHQNVNVTGSTLKIKVTP